MLIQEICRDCTMKWHIDTHAKAAIRADAGRVNVLVDTGHLFLSDIDRFFTDPESDEEVFIVVPARVTPSAETTWAQVLAGVGSFPSVSQARKAGWNKPIENGFTPTFKVGRKWFTALKPTDSHGAHGTKIEHGWGDPA